ncbi:glycosyl transferase family 1 [Leptospira borgpetersenii]|uniref:glycosyl transferase family 1 n=1 Tax=Leptospira borgpetersenii TaxID=174 RepID=UPI0007739B47|nr:glycosyl transferase family 1 [Leptospira borgpetersenii]MBE8398961.1 glycosyl transferase family 1 [Leptospira borgpetersenii serovar Tarassovi]MBE8402066.1 glycosyl transferase family 1 [Leptospira borgpetersenii serovar Tarassovi]MBE8406330.1 glycosyl transferase family 1 [Leptospira borgpetersenii serovar Tarassovi]MBE8413874.1 glycosyl transferase family 1 [Leptospira borgpetersenii serovar Tarassovi]MBE8414914.1 glycosyl transferase family 1 [Leptospira borgpetersenii serovar Tarassov
MNVLILTEAGNKIGFGHISRMSALAYFLHSTGIEVKILLYLNSNTQFGGTFVEKCNWLHDKSVYKLCSDFDIILIDSYLAEFQIYRSMRSYCKRIIAIDDYNRIIYPVDAIINPNVFFDQIDYSNQSSKCFGGLDFIILRESFRKSFELNSNDEKGILITLGGSDYRNLLSKLCELLNSNHEQVTVICPEEKKAKELQGKYREICVLGLLNESDMLHEFLKAKVVVSGCGQTLHELYYLGKRTVAICIDHDQIMNQQYYLSINFLKTRIHWNSPFFLSETAFAIDFAMKTELVSSSMKINPIRNLENYISLFKDMISY